MVSGDSPLFRPRDLAWIQRPIEMLLFIVSTRIDSAANRLSSWFPTAAAVVGWILLTTEDGRTDNARPEYSEPTLLRNAGARVPEYALARYCISLCNLRRHFTVHLPWLRVCLKRRASEPFRGGFLSRPFEPRGDPCVGPDGERFLIESFISFSEESAD